MKTLYFAKQRQSPGNQRKARKQRTSAVVATTAPGDETAMEVEENYDQLGLNNMSGSEASGNEEDNSSEQQTSRAVRTPSKKVPAAKDKSDSNDQMMKMLEQMQRAQLTLIKDNQEIRQQIGEQQLQIGTIIERRSSVGGGSSRAGSVMEEEADAGVVEGEEGEILSPVKQTQLDFNQAAELLKTPVEPPKTPKVAKVSPCSPERLGILDSVLRNKDSPTEASKALKEDRDSPESTDTSSESDTSSFSGSD